ncbi:MAG TPA: prolipoprotein diacylglyceryl transferase family protein [Candidatus Acidoferrales bacterium]|nr:prolipoprotein diacylglyceryl transferase family protein [Candidatus Acidoferrales bacterium]
MMPFLHIGPFTLATYGLCVGIAMLVSYFVLARDFARRGISAPADLMVAVPCIAGLVGAKLYHVLEAPKELFADPRLLVSQYGFAWFGGFLGGFFAFVILARYYRVPLLEVFDAASPAAALGYGLGRIGCLLSGDGDYGIPTSLPWGMSFPNGTVPTTERVHPTPIYELMIAILIFWWLWRIGERQVRAATKTKVAEGMFGPERGTVFAQYLVLNGVARFLVEFIRINPRSFFGMTNAQTASLVSVILGAMLLWNIRKRGRT